MSKLQVCLLKITAFEVLTNIKLKDITNYLCMQVSLVNFFFLCTETVWISYSELHCCSSEYEIQIAPV